MSAKVFRLIECDPSESVETRIVRYAEKEITNEIHVPVHFGTLYSGRGSGVKILPKNPRSCPRSHRFSSVFRQSHGRKPNTSFGDVSITYFRNLVIPLPSNRLVVCGKPALLFCF